MSGYNWVIFEVTAVDGSMQNMDVNLNLDIHSVTGQNPNSIDNDWIFYGDSITAGAMSHCTLPDSSSSCAATSGTAAYQALITSVLGLATDTTTVPIQENGAIAGTDTNEAVSNINSWLTLFPGKYVALDYGSNDGCNADFKPNLETLIATILTYHKVPIIPLIPWARDAGRQQCAQQDNTFIQSLYIEHPQIVKGPDFYSYFNQNQALISSDNLHPTDIGFATYRQLWATTMIANVYKGINLPTVSYTILPMNTSLPTITPSVTPVSTVKVTQTTLVQVSSTITHIITPSSQITGTTVRQNPTISTSITATQINTVPVQVQILNITNKPLQSTTITVKNTNGTLATIQTDQNGNASIDSGATIQTITSGSNVIPVQQPIISGQTYQVRINTQKGTIASIVGFQSPNFLLIFGISILCLSCFGFGVYFFRKEIHFINIQQFILRNVKKTN